MDGFVTDYVSAFLAEMVASVFEEYAQIMTGYGAPLQVPVTSALARRLRDLRPLVLRGAVADVPPMARSAARGRAIAVRKDVEWTGPGRCDPAERLEGPIAACRARESSKPGG